MPHFLSNSDSISRSHFNQLWAELKHDFSALWKEANSSAESWRRDKETLCVSICPCIGRWFSERGVVIGMVWGAREWGNQDDTYFRFEYGHMFNLIYIDEEEYIIDGTFKQFDPFSDRLRVFSQNDSEFTSYLRRKEWAFESMIDLLCWSNTISGEPCDKLPQRVA